MAGFTGTMRQSSHWVNNDGVWTDNGQLSEEAEPSGEKSAAATLAVLAGQSATLDLLALPDTAFGKNLVTSFTEVSGYSFMNTGTVVIQLNGVAANYWAGAWKVIQDLAAGDMICFTTDDAEGLLVTPPNTLIQFDNSGGVDGEIEYILTGR